MAWPFSELKNKERNVFFFFGKMHFNDMQISTLASFAYYHPSKLAKQTNKKTIH